MINPSYNKKLTQTTTEIIANCYYLVIKQRFITRNYQAKYPWTNSINIRLLAQNTCTNEYIKLQEFDLAFIITKYSLAATNARYIVYTQPITCKILCKIFTVKNSPVTCATGRHDY